ncbi:MAG: LLM class flavin-dependent oxidoreductase, partial [Bosea sp. (in: a-proteobacteria)]|nr:LLM class flavin-dependent oxidoreductase [Bosea sp. (in: a-proteobacteria)]
MVAISVLDLVPVREGEEPGDALRASIDLARHAEALGYTRYWVAEHHNMVGIASAAT